MTASVSLCMIVKNEEDFIEKCIGSVKDYVNEIILVDTGSRDKTIEKALLCGAKIYSFKWENNFADARNFALSKAIGEWILFMDADETLENPHILQEVISSGDAHGYYVTIQNISENGQILCTDMVVRLFKNHHSFQFIGAIHEQIAGSILTMGKCLKKCPLVIKHFGYSKDVIKRKKKISRNMRIIKKELQKHPEDPFLYYSLAMEEFLLERTLDGVHSLRKALDFANGTESYYKDMVVRLLLGLIRLGRIDESKNIAEAALKKLPGEADILFLNALCKYESGEILYSLDILLSLKCSEDNYLCPEVLNSSLIKNILSILHSQFEVYSDYKEKWPPKFVAQYKIINNIHNMVNFLLREGIKQDG